MSTSRIMAKVLIGGNFLLGIATFSFFVGVCLGAEFYQNSHKTLDLVKTWIYFLINLDSEISCCILNVFKHCDCCYCKSEIFSVRLIFFLVSRKITFTHVKNKSSLFLKHRKIWKGLENWKVERWKVLARNLGLNYLPVLFSPKFPLKATIILGWNNPRTLETYYLLLEESFTQLQLHKCKLKESN